MNHKLQQFKGQSLTCDNAEAYAKIRLGLGDDWCAYSWTHMMPEYEANEVLDELDPMDAEDVSTYFLNDLRDRMSGSQRLPKDQMIVKLCNAPNVKVAREVWDNEDYLEEKVCLVDWDLLQETLPDEFQKRR